MPAIAYKVPDLETLGLFLKFERIKRRWSRGKALSKIGDTGITISMLRHWEDGKAPIPFRSMVDLCNLYQVSIHKLLTSKR